MSAKVPTIVLVGGVVAATVAKPARADDCATVMNAMIAQEKVPYAASMTATGPDAGYLPSESIFTDEKMYPS